MLRIEIAKLQQQIIGNDKALIIAKDVSDARELGTKAHTASLYATFIGILGLLLGILEFFFKH